MKQISIAIPTYNRFEMTLDSFSDVYNDERVGEIVIVDDASDMDIFLKLKAACDALPKVHLYRNLTNQDCYANKMIAISYCNNEYCILLDSDNKIGKDYIDRLCEQKWVATTILTPDFAKPHFDFRLFSGTVASRRNIYYLIDQPMFEVCMNAANFFVNRNEYLKAWDSSVDPVTSDSIFFMLKWLELGNMFHIVKDLQYEHRVHGGSHYQNNVHRTTKGFHESILTKLRQLK